MNKMNFCSHIAVLAFAALFPVHIWACATVVGAGTTLASIAEEEAVIVWNPAQRIEHFVRRAKFDASTPFGFIVPTPSRPELAEADDKVFDRLAERVSQLQQQQRALRGTKSFQGHIAIAQSVQILEQRTVAGLHATVIKADDAKTLQTWLEGEGFSARPSFVAWAEPYVKGHWIFTAFRYVPVTSKERLTSRAVRLSFTTEKPVFPYREPNDATAIEGRSLRIYLISPHPMGSRLATEFISPIDHLGETLQGVVPDIPHGSIWLQTFFDRSNGRQGAEDLYFKEVPAPSH